MTLTVNKGTIVISFAIVAIITITFLLLPKNVDVKPELSSYNGYLFVQNGNLWSTEWKRGEQVYRLDFRFHPSEVENISISGKGDIRLQLEQVFLTFDPSDEVTKENAYMGIAAIELARKLTDPFERNVTAACTRNETVACIDRPIVTCKSTNSTVFHLKQGTETKIILDGNCITVEGNGEEIVRAADNMIYQWLGILK